MTLRDLEMTRDLLTTRRTPQSLQCERGAPQYVNVSTAPMIAESDPWFAAVESQSDIAECSANLAHERIRTAMARSDTVACSFCAHDLEEVRRRVC